MDIVLEVFDTFVGDRAYARTFPASIQNGLSVSNSSQISYYHAPSTKYLSLEPSDFAYQSRFSRDNIYRQALSLFFIQWYVLVGEF